MNLKERIIKISKKNGLTHLSSNLTSVTAIAAIYATKKPDESFILSNGHAGLALYVATHKDNDALPILENIHADSRWCDCSTGSLGHGLPISVGIGLSDRSKTVYCMVSDGELAEGSCWESLRFAADQKLTNLKLIVNANGLGAYKTIDTQRLILMVNSFGWGVWPCDDIKEEIIKGLKVEIPETPICIFVSTNVNKYPFLEGVRGHYVKVPDDYKI
jgi:transketolase N-terminal domain/subunit